MRECINDALSLSEDNAVDDDNPVGEDHQHLEETFDDFDQHPLDTHDTSHDIDPMGKPLSLYKIVLPVCVFYCIAAFSGEEVVCSYEELVRVFVSVCVCVCDLCVYV